MGVLTISGSRPFLHSFPRRFEGLSSVFSGCDGRAELKFRFPSICHSYPGRVEGAIPKTHDGDSRSQMGHSHPAWAMTTICILETVHTDTDMGVCIQMAANERSFSARTEAAPLRCIAARRRGDLESAFRLIYERYHHDGLADWSPRGVRILPHQLLDTSWVLLARRGRRLYGTLSLVEDGAMGLPMEQLYPAEIWRLRRQEKRVAELACFALWEKSASENRSVLRALLDSACRIAVERAIDEVVICVHPRRAAFYERRLGFQEIGATRCCPWVCNQPAVAMKLALTTSNRTDAVTARQAEADSRWPSTAPTQLRRADRAYFLRLLDSAPAMTRVQRVAA